MYLVTTPSGAQYEYVHPLAAGEKFNNSFDAISLMVNGWSPASSTT